MIWDVFISHASEDKDDVARPLFEMLRSKGVNVWYFEDTLNIGDRLRSSIDNGLKKCRYAVVILSHHFFAKKWPQDELDGLLSLESSGKDRILPVWHNVTADDVKAYSPMLSGRKGVPTSSGLDNIVAQLVEKVMFFSVMNHHGRNCRIDVSKCEPHGIPIVPHWIHSDPERISSPWLVGRFSLGAELRLYFDGNWCDGTWFVVDVPNEDGEVINLDQLQDLMPTTATTTTTPPPEGANGGRPF